MNSEALSQKCVSRQEAHNRDNQLSSMINAKVLIFHPFLLASTPSQPYLNQHIFIEHLLYVMSLTVNKTQTLASNFSYTVCAIAQQTTSGQKKHALYILTTSQCCTVPHTVRDQHMFV